ncbi:Protein F31A3.5, partial [Aphelenchoides avenae]
MPFLVLRRYTLCACLQRKRPRRDNATSTDDDDTYGVIAPTANGTSENKSTVPVKNGSARNGRADEPSCKEGRSRTFISAFRKSHAQRELPQLPTTSKKVSFFPADLPLIDDCAPTYESIDNDENDSVSDPHYSKLVNGPALRYDYPTFGPRERHKRVEEPFYTSASQTYSVGSEDPYSSIVSENDGGRKALNDDASSSYDPGYARVRDGPKDGPSTSTFSNIDALYAKVNRPFSRKRSEPLYAPSQGPPTLQDSAMENGNREVPVMRQESFYQLGESGSGSVVSDSSGSRNPSYRYLTVRENIEVVRERIRRQQAELEESTPAIREHYYSTIGNDYETVGSVREGTYSVVDDDAASASRSRAVERSTPITSPLELRLRHSMPHANVDVEPPPEPPKPPTSPIPNRIPGETPPPRPIVLSANFAPLPRIAEITSAVHTNGSAGSAYTSSRATSQPDLAVTSVFRSWKERNSAYQSRPMSTYLPSTSGAYHHQDEPPPPVMSLSMEEPTVSSS